MDYVEQAAEKPGKEKQTVTEILTIPKHRFDCVNLCLKETKQALRDKSLEAEAQKTTIIELTKALLDAKVETSLALHRARNLTAVKALINFSDSKPEQDGSMPGLEEQILRIKKSQNYLFESQEAETYVLVPVKNGEPLNKSIASYIKNSRRTEK